MTPSDLYDEARRRLEELCKYKDLLETNLEGAPKENVHVVTGARKTQFYVRNNPKDKSGTYLSQKETSKIKKLLQKQYDEQSLKAVKKEISILERLLKSPQANTKLIQQIFSNKPMEIKKQIVPVDCSDDDYIQWWLSELYVKKEISDELPVYITDNGERVRSKSELNIANMLFKYGIPYKYEHPLEMRGRIIYPDFTVLDIRRRKEVYWEHRGMMDDRDYAKHSVKRINNYMENGYYLGDDLVITEECSGEPLGTREIQSIIRHYFAK